MLLVTLAAVLCGLTAAAPGLGIPLAVLVTPALIRTFAVSNVSRAQGIEPSAEAKLASFVASIGLMLLIVVAGFAVFFVGCCACLFRQHSKSGGHLWQSKRSDHRSYVYRCGRRDDLAVY